MSDAHGELGCSGLLGGCPECVRIYRLVAGDQVGLCVLCDAEHWPWEPHAGDDAGPGDELGEQPGDAGGGAGSAAGPG